MKKFSFILFFLLFSFQLIAQQKPIVRAEFDTTQIKIGEQAKLTLSATFQSGKKIQFPVLKDTLSEKVEIVSIAKPDTVFNQDDLQQQTISQTYQITAFDTGYYAIRPFQFIYEKDTLETQPFLLIVKTIDVDTTQAIKDIKAPIEVSYTFVDWLKDNYQWVLLGMALIALIIGVIWYVRKQQKKPKIEKEAPKIAIAADIEALEKLKDIDSRKIWQSGEIKMYYSEITDVLREYLERRFHVSVFEKTTDELMQTIRLKSIAQDDRDSLHELFKLADLVKFAKEKPIGVENEESMNIAVRFVQHTKASDMKINTLNDEMK